MKHNWNDTFGRVELRPLAAEDLERQRILRNQNKQWFCSSNDISPQEQERWFLEYLKRDNDYMFSVWYRPEAVWIGSVALYCLDVQKRRAEFGRLLIDHTAGKASGLGVDATICACRIGWKYLGLLCIFLEVYADNLPALSTYERAGFIPYGQAVDSKGRVLIKMIQKRKEENDIGHSST